MKSFGEDASERGELSTHAERTASAATELLRRLEASLGLSNDPLHDPFRDAQRLLHELSIHAAELQLQNEALMRERAANAQLVCGHRDFSNLCSVGCLGVDAAGTIVQENANAAVLVGRRPGALNGLKLASLVTPDSASQINRRLAQVPKIDERGAFEVAVIKPSGDRVILRIASMSVEPEHDGQVVCRLAITDETRRARSEELSKESEARLRAIVDAAPDAIIAIDEHNLIQSFNPAASRIFGFSEDEVIGANVSMLIPSPHRESHDRLLHQYRQRGEPQLLGKRHEVEGQRKDGSRFSLEMTIGVRVGGAFTAILHENAERKRLESQFRQAQKMEVLGQLAAGVAHDFNNVLMGITGCVDMALRKKTQEDARPFLLEIKAAVSSGTSIVRNLMSFGQRHDAQETEVVVLDEVVRRAVPLLRRTTNETIDIVLALDAGEACINRSAGTIEQILVNLALNARDAMPNGGTLRIESSQESQWVTLSVSDTGNGMDEATRARIFEPFFTTKGAMGSGLGLAMISGAVRQMGGTIEVQSQVAVGTSFHLRLPRVASVEPGKDGNDTTPSQPSELSAKTGETILLVEDDPRVRMSIRHYLDNAGFEVLDAADGIEALRIAREHEGAIDLVLADVVLPGGLSGVSVVKALSAAKGPATMLMSAHGPTVAEDIAALDPDISLLHKPFSEEVLLKAIRAMLDKHQSARRA